MPHRHLRRQCSVARRRTLVSRRIRRLWLEPLEDRRLLATLSAALDEVGNLTIADIDISGKENELTVSVSGTDLVIRDAAEQFASAPVGGTLTGGDQTLVIPQALITGSLTFALAGGLDQLTVDRAGGDPIPAGNIAFAGGNPTSAPGDKLAIVGGGQGVGGITTFDSDGPALLALLAEWNSDRRFDERMLNICTADGPILAGTGYRLKNDETVLDDGSLDTLNGAAAIDWLFSGGDDDLHG